MQVRDGNRKALRHWLPASRLGEFPFVEEPIVERASNYLMAFHIGWQKVRLTG